MAISEWELWAVASKLIEQHGDGAYAFAVERLNAIVLVGDEAGLTTWSSIIDRMAQLQDEVGLTQSRQ